MVSQQPATRCEPNTGNYTAMPETPSKELADALSAVAIKRDKQAVCLFILLIFSPKIKRFGY